MTSRWIFEVASLRGFEVSWHPISLEIINEGHPAGDHAEGMRHGRRMGRVAVAAERLAGPQAVGGLYTAFGERIHPGAREDFDGIIVEALAEAGLSADLFAAADDLQFDDELRANTDHALAIAGPNVGVPIISIDGVAFFGPVVTPAPTGDLALQLWDGIRAAASVPGFYELKRGRTVGPQF